MTSIQQARELVFQNLQKFDSESVNIDEAHGRILAEDVLTDRDYPPFNRSAMDGYAVQSSDFQGGSVQLHLIERLMAGGVAKHKVVAGTCIKIMTGAPVPEGADAVVKVEDCTEEGDVVCFNVGSVKVQQNIAKQGEDALSGDLLIPKSTLLGAGEIAALAVVGKAKVLVFKSPEISIFSTGNEIVRVNAPILPHQIRDSNAHFLKNALKVYVSNPINTELVQDDKSKLKEVLAANLDKNILILSGGVSKGDADYVPEVLAAVGVKELFHRVQIKPGAPLWFGVMPNGGVVFALPGNPVAVQVAYKVFIEPYIRKSLVMSGLEPFLYPLGSSKKKRSKFDEFFPCKLMVRENQTCLVPTKINGSGDIAATLNSDGIALHPAEMDVVAEGNVVSFYPWNANNKL